VELFEKVDSYYYSTPPLLYRVSGKYPQYFSGASTCQDAHATLSATVMLILRIFLDQKSSKYFPRKTLFNLTNFKFQCQCGVGGGGWL
jgi:hypothetical protein